MSKVLFIVGRPHVARVPATADAWPFLGRSVEGLTVLDGGVRYVGVAVKQVIEPGGVVDVSRLDLRATSAEQAEARRLCDALPVEVADDPDLRPFGFWLVASAA